MTGQKTMNDAQNNAQKWNILCQKLDGGGGGVDFALLSSIMKSLFILHLLDKIKFLLNKKGGGTNILI